MIAMIAIMLPRASVAANRVYEIIETKPTIQDPTNPVALDESKKDLLNLIMFHLLIQGRVNRF